jgi:hypothetical protein
MFFKRRSRTNSYIDSDALPRSQSYDDYEKRPDSSSAPAANNNNNNNTTAAAANQVTASSPTDEKDMYPRQQAPQEASYPSRGLSNANGNSMPSMGGLGNPTPPLASGKPEPMPDLLTQAFQQAIRPYTDKIEQLEAQLADMQNWVEQLEQQRAEVHGWIDKRGLRPGTYTFLPFSICSC